MLHLHELQFSSRDGLDRALVVLHDYAWVETCIVEDRKRSVRFSAPPEHIGVLLTRLTGRGEVVDWQISSLALAS